jgi:hypothetical protein
MEFWEFLIQKEGDRSWLPLESSTVEILEGRYRMVARSSRVNTPVEIRVIHDAIYEDPPKRRIQKRANRTNHDGLIVVMPFTFLQAGSWELVCTGDLMADMLGDTWTYQVKLQVVLSDQDLGDGYDWGGDHWADAHAALLAGQASPYVAKQPDAKQSDQQPDHLSVSPVSASSSIDESPMDESAINESPAADSPVDPLVGDPLVGDPLVSASAPESRPELSPEPHLDDRPEPISAASITDTDTNTHTDSDIATNAALSPETTVPEIDGSDVADLTSEATSSEDASSEMTAADLAAMTPQQIWQNAEASSEQLMAELFAGFESMAVDVVDAQLNATEDYNAQEPAHAPADLSVVSLAEQAEPVEQTEPAKQQNLATTSELTSPPSDAEAARSLTSEPQISNPLHDLWQIHLASSHYVIRQGTGLTLSGQVSGLYPDVEDYDLRWLYLEAVLRNPQTGDVLQTLAHPLEAEHLPCGFALDLEIQSADETHLFLGELNLMCRPSPEITPRVLASQSFSVTADLNNLLNAIANEFAESQDLQPPLVFLDQSEANLNLTFLNLIESPEAIAAPVQSTGHTVLPPQLHEPTQDKPRSKSIDLPFTHSPATEAFQPHTQEQFQAESQEPTEPEHLNESAHESAQVGTSAEPLPAVRDRADDLSSPQPAIAQPQEQEQEQNSDALPLGEQTPGNAPAAPSDVSPLLAEPEWELPPDVWQTPVSPLLRPSAQPEPAEASADDEQSPEDEAFRALNLQERFLSRLNSLASDPELGRLLQRTDPADAVPSQDAPFDWDDPLVSTEVVVDDEVVFPDDRPTAASVSFMEPPMSDLDGVEELPILPEDQPIPAPQMLLKSGELTAGEMVSIVVKLPDVASRIYVKLWLYDLQNCTRLDGPKWLINFLPDSQGQLEARSQLMVPFGCREVQFEAIAIEMATQRESRKVILEREVIPPDLPLSSIDQWDELNF